MDRPIMHPVFEHELPKPPKPRLHKRLLRIPGLFVQLLLMDVAFWRREKLKLEEGSPAWRIIVGLCYRLLFVPVFLFGMILAMVYLGTHPPRNNPMTDPSSRGMYFDPVAFTSLDGARLEGWLIPLLDAKVVLEQRDKILKRKNPAVVLIHDHGGGRVQMLPLAKELHDAGFIVLVPTLRGTAQNVLGSTFGLREADDVLAAVDLLRRRPGVDGGRIAVIGRGTGANAAAIAAGRDPALACLILDHPVASAEQVVEQYFAPPQKWLRSLRPVAKWAFELSYRVDADELDSVRQLRAYKGPILMFDQISNQSATLRGPELGHARDFLSRHLGPDRGTTANLPAK